MVSLPVASVASHNIRMCEKTIVHWGSLRVTNSPFPHIYADTSMELPSAKIDAGVDSGQ